MKSLAFLALAASASLCLAGCSTTDLTASTGLVNALAAAGCKGTVHIAATATTSVVGVPGANLTNTFDGSCDPTTAPAAPTLASPAVAAK